MKGKKEINVLVGASIKRERERAGYTQEKFSELIGMGPKSLSAIERGTVGISLSAFQKVCEVLSISSDMLLFPSKEKNDIQVLADRLGRLSPKEFEIAAGVFSKLMEAFEVNKSK